MQSPSCLRAPSLSLPKRCLAETSARKPASAMSSTFRPAGQGREYSKYPAPAPFTFSPSSTFHCFSDHSAFLKLLGARRTTLIFPEFDVIVSSRGDSPCDTRYVVKLRCRTFPDPSSKARLSTASAGLPGIVTESGFSSLLIQGL